LIVLAESCSGETVSERRPRCQQNIILVHSHHVGSFATEDADQTKHSSFGPDAVMDAETKQEIVLVILEQFTAEQR
jgi:molybdopterin-guanine dinucleotide biosynthesis protein